MSKQEMIDLTPGQIYMLALKQVSDQQYDNEAGLDPEFVKGLMNG